jgi:hypothetical protein
LKNLHASLAISASFILRLFVIPSLARDLPPLQRTGLARPRFLAQFIRSSVDVHTAPECHSSTF